MKNIQSLTNKKIKYLLALKKSSKRKDLGRFLIDGQREVEAAIEAKVKIEQVFVCKDLVSCASQIISQLEPKLITFVSISVFKKISIKNKPDGYLALARNSNLNLDDIKLKASELIIILENIEKPGNIGAIIRTACAAGVNNIILSDNQTDIYNPNTIRASEGLIFKLNIIESSNRQVFDWLTSKNIPVYAASTDTGCIYSDVSYKNRTALVFGSESKGLKNFWLERCNQLIKIPMTKNIDSLNVSVSLAIIVYEALRQRGVFDN